MKLGLEIEEVPEGLSIRSVRKGSVFYALLSAIVIGAFVFFMGRVYFHRPALLVLTALSAVWGSSRWWRAVRVELRVNNLEIQVIGHQRSVPGLNRIIPLSTIQRLEYRPGQEHQPNKGEGESDSPSGLYVEQRWKADCVLPHLNEQQTQEAIDAIYKRFPVIPILPPREGRDGSGRDVIRLNLDSPQNAHGSANR
jgi:hypothetical protein